MSKIWDWGITLRPTPTARKNRTFKQEVPKSDMREKYVHCKICGFYANTDRDSQCPFCKSTQFNK